MFNKQFGFWPRNESLRPKVETASVELPPPQHMRQCSPALQFRKRGFEFGQLIAAQFALWVGKEPGSGLSERLPKQELSIRAWRIGMLLELEAGSLERFANSGSHTLRPRYETIFSAASRVASSSTSSPRSPSKIAGRLWEV